MTGRASRPRGASSVSLACRNTSANITVDSAFTSLAHPGDLGRFAAHQSDETGGLPGILVFPSRTPLSQSIALSWVAINETIEHTFEV
jgi:hypothetical protein